MELGPETWLWESDRLSKRRTLIPIPKVEILFEAKGRSL